MESLLDLTTLTGDWLCSEECEPQTVVLRPSGTLDKENSIQFRKALEDALQRTRETVVVDFLWVDKVEEAGLHTIIEGMEHAIALGKNLSLRFLHAEVWEALEVEALASAH